jgi:hypothetical protein
VGRELNVSGVRDRERRRADQRGDVGKLLPFPLFNPYPLFDAARFVRSIAAHALIHQRYQRAITRLDLAQRGGILHRLTKDQEPGLIKLFALASLLFKQQWRSLLINTVGTGVENCSQWGGESWSRHDLFDVHKAGLSTPCRSIECRPLHSIAP